MKWSVFSSLGLVFGLSLGAIVLIMPTAGAMPSAPPQLSITVENGQTSADVGDSLSYVITLTNLGTTHVSGLRVSQTMPEGLKFTSADHKGVSAANDEVVWSVDLAPTSHATLKTRMEVTSTPKELLRLATVACAAVSSKKPPLVCATHSDELPAGAQASAASASKQTRDDGGSSGLTRVQYVAVGCLLGLLVALIVLGIRVRTSRAARG